MIQKKKEIRLLIVSILIGLIASLCFLEYYFREKFWHDVNTKFDSELGWTNYSNKKVKKGRTTYSTNSLGFRSSEIDFKKRHLLLVGDSVVWGYGVDDTETVSHFLSQKVADLQVLNLGVSGYGIGQYYLHLKRHIKTLNPKTIVVVIFSGNDLENLSRDTEYGKSKPLFGVRDDQFKKEELIQSNNLILFNKNISRFSCANLFSKSWILRQSIFSYFRKKICRPKSLKSLQELDYVLTVLLLKIKDLAIAKNANLMFVIWPATQVYLFDSEEDYLMTEKKVQSGHGESIQKYDKSSLIQYKYYRFLKRKLSVLNLPYLDFTSVVQNKGLDHELLYLKGDFAHLSPFGNNKFAESLHDIISSRRQTQ